MAEGRAAGGGGVSIHVPRVERRKRPRKTVRRGARMGQSAGAREPFVKHPLGMIAGECLSGAPAADRPAPTVVRTGCGAWDTPLGAFRPGTEIAPHPSDMVMNDLAGVSVMTPSVEPLPRADAVARGALLKLTGGMDLREVSGIVIVIDDCGRVVDATEAAGPLTAALGGGTQGGLADLVDRAFAAGPVCEPVTLGDATAYTLAVLPLDRGGALIIGRDATLEQNLRNALVEIAPAVQGPRRVLERLRLGNRHRRPVRLRLAARRARLLGARADRPPRSRATARAAP